MSAERRRLRRGVGAGDRPPAPTRIVHFGAGAFHRSHQAWFTARASDADQWGIAAFTGRSDTVVRQLAPQDGLFTLVERGPVADSFQTIDSIVAVHPASDGERLHHLLSAPRTSLVTITITEAGYHLTSDGSLDTDDADVRHDIRVLQNDDRTALRTPLAGLLAGLAARRRAGSGPLSVVPCDNLPDNGGIVRRSLRELADATGRHDALTDIAFVSSSVDRITPHTTDADRSAVADATGFRDEACVVAEPFADWTLRGDFPAGCPDWISAGARQVDDLLPYEQRKLLLLNGGHLVLAFEGLRRGHETISQSMADAACRTRLEAFWDEAGRTVGDGRETQDYRAALVARFSNPRIEHRLSQIAVDTETKTRLRIVPVIVAERAAGRSAAAARDVVDTWRSLLETGRLTADPRDVRGLLETVEAAAPPLPASHPL